jgi:hypothetical protein
VHDVGGHVSVTIIRDKLSRHEPAESALIDESQFASVVAEADSHSQMLLVNCLVRLHQQLTTHAEVSNECGAVIEWKPQVLASPTHAAHRAPDECSVEGAVLPAHCTGMQDIDMTDGSRGYVLRKSAAHDLDLRQLGHQEPVISRTVA